MCERLRRVGHNKMAIVFIIFFIVLGIGFFMPQNFVHADLLDDTTNVLMDFFGFVALTMAGFFLKMSIFLLKFVIELAGYNAYLDSPAVTVGWVMVRDITNMFFVVILLAIAFGTILGVEQYEWKKLLVKFVLAAIFVNFSRIICGVIIDAAQVVMVTFVNGVAATAGGNLINAFNLDTITSLSKNADAAQIANPSASFIGCVAAATFTGMLMVMLGVYVIILLGRMITLWILIVLSPLAFVFSVLPQTQNYGKEWWKEFGNHVVAGPLVIFFIWLAFVTVGGGDIHDKMVAGTPKAAQMENLDQETNAVGGSGAGIGDAMTWASMANFFIALGMLFVGAKKSQELSVTGGSMMSNAVDYGKKVAAIASGYTAGRWVAGGATNLAKKGAQLAAWKMPLGGQFWTEHAQTLGFAAKAAYKQYITRGKVPILSRYARGAVQRKKRLGIMKEVDTTLEKITFKEQGSGQPGNWKRKLTGQLAAWEMRSRVRDQAGVDESTAEWLKTPRVKSGKNTGTTLAQEVAKYTTDAAEMAAAKDTVVLEQRTANKQAAARQAEEIEKQERAIEEGVKSDKEIKLEEEEKRIKLEITAKQDELLRDAGSPPEDQEKLVGLQRRLSEADRWQGTLDGSVERFIGLQKLAEGELAAATQTDTKGAEWFRDVGEQRLQELQSEEDTLRDEVSNTPSPSRAQEAAFLDRRKKIWEKKDKLHRECTKGGVGEEFWEAADHSITMKSGVKGAQKLSEENQNKRNDLEKEIKEILPAGGDEELKGLNGQLEAIDQKLKEARSPAAREKDASYQKRTEEATLAKACIEDGEVGVRRELMKLNPKWSKKDLDAEVKRLTAGYKEKGYIDQMAMTYMDEGEAGVRRAIEQKNPTMSAHTVSDKVKKFVEGFKERGYGGRVSAGGLKQAREERKKEQAETALKAAERQVNQFALGISGIRNMFNQAQVNQTFAEAADKFIAEIKEAELQNIFKKGLSDIKLQVDTEDKMAKLVMEQQKEERKDSPNDRRLKEIKNEIAQLTKISKERGKTAGALLARGDIASKYAADKTGVVKQETIDEAESIYTKEHYGYSTPSTAFKSLIKKKMDEYTGIEREQAVQMALDNLSMAMAAEERGETLESDQKAMMMASTTYLTKQAWSDDLLAAIVNKINSGRSGQLSGKAMDEARVLDKHFGKKWQGEDGRLVNESSNVRTNELHRVVGLGGNVKLKNSEDAVLELMDAKGLSYKASADLIGTEMSAFAQSVAVQGENLQQAMADPASEFYEIAQKLGLGGAEMIEKLKAFTESFVAGSKTGEEAGENFRTAMRSNFASGQMLADAKNMALTNAHLDDGGHTLYDAETGIFRGQTASHAMDFVLSDWRKLTARQRMQRLKSHSISQMNETTGTVAMDAHNLPSMRETFAGVESRIIFDEIDSRTVDHLASLAAGEAAKINSSGRMVIGGADSIMQQGTFGHITGAVQRQQEALKQIADNFAVTISEAPLMLAAALGKRSNVSFDRAVEGNFQIELPDGSAVKTVEDMLKFIEDYRSEESKNTVIINKEKVKGAFQARMTENQKGKSKDKEAEVDFVEGPR